MKLSSQLFAFVSMVALISGCSKIHLYSSHNDAETSASNHANLSVNSGGGISKGTGILMRVSIGETPGLGIPNPQGAGVRVRGGLQGAVNSQ